VTKIKNYDQDIEIDLQDKLLGTDINGNPTKNYPFYKIIDFLLSQGVGEGGGDVSGKEDKFNKVSTVAGNESDLVKYPNTKALYDGLVAAVSEANSYTSSIFTGTAQDDQVVHLDGNETINDFKIFTELVTASGFRIPGGIPAGFHKADGSIDYSEYITLEDIPEDETLVLQATNKTGVAIPKGSVVYIDGAQGSKPTIALALADSNVTTSLAIGIVKDTIANNANGVVVTNGLIESLDTSAFAEGNKVFLSSVLPGGMTTVIPSSPNNVVAIGTVIDAHATQGKILVSILYTSKLDRLVDVDVDSAMDNDVLQYNSALGLWENRSELEIGSIQTDLITIGNTELDEKLLQLNNASLSTGLYEFGSGGLTNNSSTSFNIGNVKGFIVDSDDPLDSNPLFIDYPGIIGQTTPWLLSHAATYVLIKPDLTPMLLNARPTVTQRKDNIFLGVVGHPNGAIGGIGNSPDLIMNVMSQVRAMFEPIRFINGGIVCYANGTNMALANTPGNLYGLGIGFITNGNDAPSVLAVSAGTPSTFQYRTYIGTVFANTTLIEGGFYDLTGVRTAIPGSSNQATNQRIYLLQNGAIRIQYGQNLYSTLNNAISAASSEVFVEVTNNRSLGILIGILAVTKGCTDLSDVNTAKFLSVSKFGESNIAAAGIAIGTLQTAYKNSLIPQILVDDASGAFTLQNARALNTSTIQEWKNIAGTTTASITGNGLLTTAVDASINGLTVGKGSGNMSQNTAVGNLALRDNVSGNANTAIGFTALKLVTTTVNNTAVGQGALENTITSNNTAVGYAALSLNSSGAQNNAFGRLALSNITSGNDNIAMGSAAGNSLLDGVTAHTSSTQNVFLGGNTRSFANAQTNQIVIGYLALGIGSNSVVLGNDSVTKTALKGNVIMGQTGTITDTGEKLQVTGTIKATAVHSFIETNVQAGTTYILLATDNCKQIITTSSSPVTITIPTGLGTGFSCEVLQQGTGQVSFVGSGTTLRYSSFEMPSVVEIYGSVIISNISNVTNEFKLDGDLTSL